MEHWIKELLNNLDSSLDEEKRQSIIEKCGPKCPFSHMPNDELMKLRNASKTEKQFLEKLSKRWHLKHVNSEYYVVFDKCYCPLMQNDLENASKTMCYCTLGSLKHKFKISLGREVEVEMLKTVLAGDDECKFKIKV
jgi:predicted hydrocarbon binding protein